MPIVGTSASLYFPSETSEDPIVTGCVRTNGSGCAKTADTTKRYFGTEHGSEIEMVPGALNIKGGSKEPLSISFDDAVGVTIKSHKKLSLNAAGGITMKTPQSVKLKAQSQILVAKTGTKSGFSMETDLHFLSNNVIKNGSDREAFAAFDDEPTVGKKPEPKPIKKAVVAKPPAEKKKGFNWGKLAGNVLAGLAVVAVVAIAAVAIAVTLGAATAVVAAIAIGAAVAGTAAVASQAISDVQSGEVSDITAYMKAGGREALVGALSGAIFGPFGMGEALGAKMIIGGLTNGVESLVRQTLEGKGINFKTLLLDAGIGAATAGVFHGAGKLFQKASPFVKNAFSKISSNISENTRIAKIALSNMEKGQKSVVLGSNFGNVDEALGRFTKEFKKVKSGIAVVGNAENELGISNITNNSRGQAVFGELDSLGRPTGMTATVTKDMIGTGTKASQSIKPPGFAGGGPGSLGHARGHLLGKQLGGHGDDPRNLVTLFQNPVNSPVMRDFESSVRAAVENGEVVRYQSIPIHEGNNLISSGVTMSARGTGGFQLDVTILNRK
ncbi:DNA/RNA non-specific endonuclease [Clostridium estertheticum]|uniref:DNA/RNA non-specific endonuclease n=2 Tax=Clostridium estertheticum TaxID=238834 RepID=UPI00227CD654|nr:DNA/RNA non-specific endonuclease [Clostridium estertheticum]WAG63733.1 DNA/RNA non-specific endonuclease [Clostridium estertheticum]